MQVCARIKKRYSLINRNKNMTLAPETLNQLQFINSQYSRIEWQESNKRLTVDQIAEKWQKHVEQIERANLEIKQRAEFVGALLNQNNG